MWRIEQSTAYWESGRLQAVVDVARPDAGIQRVRLSQASLADLQLLQVAVRSHDYDEPGCVEDVYLRGTDLIATYAPTKHCSIRSQVYWRIIDGPPVWPSVVLESIIGIQTQSCGTRWQIQWNNTIPSQEWRFLDGETIAQGCCPISLEDSSSQRISVSAAGAALLARFAAAPYSCGQILHDIGLAEARIDWRPAQQVTSVSVRVQGEQLEKGVLRRVRSRAILLPRDSDEELLAEFLRSSVAEPPPLTT